MKQPTTLQIIIVFSVFILALGVLCWELYTYRKDFLINEEDKKEEAEDATNSDNE